LVAYSSDQTHSSMKKACVIAGIPLSNYRVIPADSNMAFPVKSLKDSIEKDKKEGLIPFFVCGTVGTTATTAMDPIKDLGLLCLYCLCYIHYLRQRGGSLVSCRCRFSNLF
jgi:aromatic-L-amino-acid decarboxylase